MTMGFTASYILAGDRPVKTGRDPEDGKIYIWAWDWERKVFVKAPEYFEHIYEPTSQDITELDEETFESRVDDLLFG